MTINDEKLDKIYDLANKAYIKCVENEKNVFLNEEISLDQINLCYDAIKITFQGSESLKYQIEARINLLLGKESIIGYYSYILNEDFSPIDDFLVFY